MLIFLILFAVVLSCLSGLPGLLHPRSINAGERVATACMGTAAATGLTAAVLALSHGSLPPLSFPWPAAGGGSIGVDPLSAFFLIPVFLIGGLGPVYGLGYQPQSKHPRTGTKLRFFWGLTVAGMVLLIISRHAMTFLFGWELMALGSYFLIAVEDQRDACCRAGWIYLIATHVGSLTLFALFALWHLQTGSYALQPIGPETVSLGMRNLFFILALIGFGLKAGIMPLHFWLPAAHANSPSHVSALMSGVVLKMGIYGLVRWFSLLPTPPAAWGAILLTLGAVSGLLGVLFAIGQHDLKRLLAYHSVENIGIILLGLGIAMLGRSSGQNTWVVLGISGCLLHVWNHSLFKSLLFLCAGSVVNTTHTRQLDRMGGLAKTMPWTAACFLVGAAAICGLPPLNGFVSEWFVYLGLLKAACSGGITALIGVPVLAMIGALAVACFVKVYGTVFLGQPRTGTGRHTHEAPWSMRVPMVILAACCVLIGIAPVWISPALDAAAACWQTGLANTLPLIGTTTPLRMITLMGLSLTALVTLLGIGLTRHTCPTRHGPTWDCGYARPTPRMQYTATSFAQMIVALFNGILRPHQETPHIAGLFPQPTHTHSHVDEAVLDRALLPLGCGIASVCLWFRRFQQGLTQHYLLYMLITLLLFLVSLLPLKSAIGQWFAR